jgi:CheY-like chemotaxis protein
VLDRTPILIAEDNPDDLLLFHLAFARAGFSNPVFSVPDGDLVIQYLQGEGLYQDRKLYPPPRLLILDLKMQRVGGLEVLTWVRKSAEWRCLPVIILTTSYFGPDIKQAYDLGANSFLTKPNEFIDFVSTVKQMGEYWLRQNRLPDASAYGLPPQLTDLGDQTTGGRMP